MSALEQLLKSQEHYNVGLEGYGGDTAAIDDGSTLDQHLSGLAEAENTQSTLTYDSEQVMQTVVAMENYAELLDKATENGGIAPMSAAFLRVGLEQYEIMLAIDEPLVPGLEDFAALPGSTTATAKASSGIKESLKKAWEVAMRIIKAIMASLKDFVRRITGAAAKVKSDAQEATKLLSAPVPEQPKPQGQLGHSKVINLQGEASAKLHANGTFIGHDLSAVADIQQVAEDLVSQLNWTARVLGTTLKQLDVDNATSVSNAANSFADEFEKLQKAIKGKAVEDTRFGKGVTVFESTVFAGNQAVYVVVPTENSTPLARLRAIRDKFKITVQTSPNAKASPNDYEFEASDVATLKRRTGEIIRTADRSAGHRTLFDKLHNTIKQAGDSGFSMTTKLDDQSLGDIDSRAIVMALTKLPNVISHALNPIAALSGHAIKTLGEQQRLLRLETAKHGY